MTELEIEQLEALLLTEQDYIVHHVPCEAVNRCRPGELAEWRRKITQWGYRVIDHFRLDREVVAVGMNIFDRFLLLHNCDSATSCPCPSCKQALDSRMYQLAAMSSLFLAIKMHPNSGASRRSRRAFKLTSFVELSRGQFKPTDICEMERTMLETVRWQVNPPTPMLIVIFMLNTIMLPDTQYASSRFDLILHVLRELSRYMTELAVCLGHECSGKTASQIAFCAVLSAMDVLTVRALPMTIRGHFVDRAVDLIGPPDQQLRSDLQKALWPELLFDENSEDSRHPISMARDFGLLDIDRIYCTVSTPPVSPKRMYHACEVSPVSVSR